MASPAATPPAEPPTPEPNPENLISLIDTFVLYGSYFLLGLGAILVITLAVFFYYLNRRSRELRDGSQPPEQPR
ncbi:MAG TPA: hypothetical protein G4O05_05550 [Caldilineae bacterium]|nr:hypothetical protein [Caldilineae bacterium]